jgi:hypothetical protein
VVSAIGSESAFAVSDQDGRFTFRTLPPGPYVVRAHLQGYLPARPRLMQVSTSARTDFAIILVKRLRVGRHAGGDCGGRWTGGRADCRAGGLKARTSTTSSRGGSAT